MTYTNAGAVARLLSLDCLALAASGLAAVKPESEVWSTSNLAVLLNSSTETKSHRMARN